MSDPDLTFPKPVNQDFFKQSGEINSDEEFDDDPVHEVPQGGAVSSEGLVQSMEEANEEGSEDEHPDNKHEIHAIEEVNEAQEDHHSQDGGN